MKNFPMRNSIILSLSTLLLTLLSIACIEDDFTTSPSDQPTFSADTLRMGETLTLDGTPTKRFVVYNRHGKMLNISSISLRDDNDNTFRLNVDGISGRSFSNVEIRPKDSIFIFVEATLPENGVDDPVIINRHLDFITNGVTSTVVLNLTGQDAIRHHDYTISSDTRWTPGRPHVIFDTLRIAAGATLTLEAGTDIRLHDKAAVKVEGTLISNGTPEKNVSFTGDRTGNVAASIPYELMSGQWGGIYFASTSRDNRLEYTSVRNSSDGLSFSPADTGSEPVATLVNCQIRNTTNYIIESFHANLKLLGCELTDASNGILHLVGGNHIINHCTVANYYLFTALGGPAIQFEHIDAASDDDTGFPFLTAEITNTIIYGNGTELSHGDLTGTGIYIRRCMMHSAGADDDNFINCIWEDDPLYYTVRNEYIFDYRLKPESPAIGAADPSFDIYGPEIDRYGVERGTPADLGAYAFVNPAE